MKKRFVNLVLCTIVAGVLMTGCSQGKNSPVATVNQLVDSVYYLKDSDAAYDNLGMTSQELRTVFTEMTEQILQSQFYPDPAEETAGEEAASEDVTDATEEAVEKEAKEIRPEAKEMAQKLLSTMQGIVKYETKIITQSSTTADVKLMLYPMDISAYYSDYISIASSLPEKPENPTEDQLAEIDYQQKQAYLDSLNGVKASKEPMEMTVNLSKNEGKWLINNMESIISDLFYIYTGNF